MIFVILGTQTFEFTRLLKYIEKFLKEMPCEKSIKIQSGYTKYNLKDKDIEQKKFFQNYNEILSHADIIIAHAGVGTLMQSLTLNKKILCVPRLKKHHEHINDHQKEISDKLANEKLIFQASTYEEFKKKLEILILKEDKLKSFKSNNSLFNSKLNKEVDDLINF